MKVAGDGWTILQLVAQLDFDREQITMLKDAVEGLHASRLQDAADTLALTKRFDKRDFLDVDLKTNIQGVYNELKGDIGRAGLVQARVDVIESELTRMREFVMNIEAREVKMAQYLERLDGDRPAEGQSIKEHFRAMYVDLETTKSHFAQSVASAEDVKMHLTTHVADTAAKFERLVSMQNDMQACVSSNSRSAGFVGASLDAGFNGHQAARLEDLTQTASNLVQDVNVLKAAHNQWNGNCHCTHVDSNTTRLDLLELVLKSSRSGGTTVPNFCGAYGTAPTGIAPIMQPPGSGVRGAMGVHADEPAGEIPPKCCSTAAGGNGVCHC